MCKQQISKNTGGFDMLISSFHISPMISFHENQYYHIYNRGNNGENIFYTEENYRYFLAKYSYYLEEYIETYAYCLLPNHFHLLVKVKEVASVDTRDAIPSRDGISKNVSAQFRKFFISYSQSINKQLSRHGSLFEKPFKRKQVNTDEYFQTLVYYIHNNPVHHGFTKNLQEWNWSSYHSLCSNKKTKLKRDEVFEWFNGHEGFSSMHKSPQQLKKLGELCLE